MRAKNLKYLRNKFEMNQTTFAKKLNIAQNTLSEYENGIRPIPDTVAQSVAYLCRTSVHDFTYVDLSACDYLFSAQNGYIPDLTLIAHAINTLFPIVDSSNTDDTTFHMGHEKLVELQNRFNTIQTIEWEEMTDCLQLFQDSWNSHKNESALANCICTIFMMCTSYYAPKNKQENKFICAIKKQTKLNYLDAQDKILRNSFNPDELSKLALQRLEFVREYDNSAMQYIKQLKLSANRDFRDLGDYYLACKYLVGFTDNEFDFETNQNIGCELLMQLYLLDNFYVHQLLAPGAAYIENADI